MYDKLFQFLREISFETTSTSLLRFRPEFLSINKSQEEIRNLSFILRTFIDCGIDKSPIIAGKR